MLSERFNISTLVDRNLDAGRGGKVAFYCEQEQVTYADLHARTCSAGRALRALGVRREQRVLLVLDDTPALPVTFLGANRIGAVPVPVNPRSRPADFRFFVEDSYAEVVVVESALHPEVAAALSGVDVTIVSADADGPSPTLPELLAEHSGELAPADTHGQDMGFWLYSSGSTGAPKGVVHLQDHIAATCERYAGEVLGVTDADVHFSSTKLFHAYGLGNGLTFPLWFGGSAVLQHGRPVPEAVLETAERFRPTLFFSVPTLYNAMLRTPGVDKRDLSSVRLCVSAAEPLPAEVWRSWRDAFDLTILDGIGSTEMLHIYCTNRLDASKPGSSGAAVPGYEIKLVGLEGQQVATGETGNMYVKGDSALASYWHRREKNKSSLQGEWYFTGDRYHLDADGFYWYEGRADDMMKIGGLWVSPIEVESALLEHPEVFEAAVVSVQVEGLAKIKAVVVPEKESVSEGLDAQLQEWCKQHLQRYQYPQFVAFVDALPKTSTGKIQRFKLRAQA